MPINRRHRHTGTPPRIAATLPQPPPRASALAMGTSAFVLISARSFYNVDEKFEQF